MLRSLLLRRLKETQLFQTLIPPPAEAHCWELHPHVATMDCIKHGCSVAALAAAFLAVLPPLALSYSHYVELRRAE